MALSNGDAISEEKLSSENDDEGSFVVGELEDYRWVFPTMNIGDETVSGKQPPEYCPPARSEEVWAFISGAALATISGIVLSISNLCAALCMENGLSASQTLFVKLVGVLIISSFHLLCYRVNILGVNKRDVLLNLLKAVTENFGRLSYFLAALLVGFTNCSAITFSLFPLLTTCISVLCLKDRCTVCDIVGIGLNIVGVVLTCSRDFLYGDTENYLLPNGVQILGYVLAALSGAIFLPTGAASTRIMSKDLHVGFIMFINALVGIILAIPAVYLSNFSSVAETLLESPAVFGYIFAMVLFYLIYIWSFNRALQLETAGRVVLLTNIVIVGNYFYRVVVLGYQGTNAWEIIGTIIIVISSLVVSGVAWKETDNYFCPHDLMTGCSCKFSICKKK
uniref:Uncharacterized protein LOC102801201 n=1 Tax=Saccoglossus kowalevskii TaxID=10224 RepID=A0ABM0MCZ5_SACKO|nr:PREDICTED: uncharacterized protein LOC102801201 [Saccoglossus kowalevskii]